MDRAAEIFLQLQMDKTEMRNGTLIYLAVEDKQAAVVGDVGIHEKVGADYWQKVVAKMLMQFRAEHLADGVCSAVVDLGEALQHYFPYNRETDKNELPDDIVFGR